MKGMNKLRMALKLAKPETAAKERAEPKGMQDEKGERHTPAAKRLAPPMRRK